MTAPPRRSFNRQQRRAAAAHRVMAACAMCDANACEVHVLKARAIYEGDPTAPSDLGICKGCPCSAGRCESCGETGQHWLGCAAVGLPEGPITKVDLQ